MSEEKCICPACGFNYKVEITEEGIRSAVNDLAVCRMWAHLYMKNTLNKGIMPTEDQIEAMKREGFLPIRGGFLYGHYGLDVESKLHDVAKQIRDRYRTAL